MLKFECKNLGTNCSYIATGNTAEDVKKNAAEHAQKVHKDLLAKMTPQQIDDMYRTVTRMTH
jgi:predicted small metal-binding protein